MSPISNFRTLLSLFILRETSWSIFFFSVSNFWLISFLKLILPPFVAVAVFFVVVGADVFGLGAAFLGAAFVAFFGAAAASFFLVVAVVFVFGFVFGIGRKYTGF